MDPDLRSFKPGKVLYDLLVTATETALREMSSHFAPVLLLATSEQVDRRELADCPLEEAPGRVRQVLATESQVEAYALLLPDHADSGELAIRIDAGERGAEVGFRLAVVEDEETAEYLGTRENYFS